jgi:ABC-2 type transport system permease protein
VTTASEDLTALLVIRQTRAEEQAGRRELVGAAVLGRHAPLAAALGVVAAGNLAVALVAAVGLVVYGLPVAGSAAFGLVYLTGGVLFGSVGAVAARLVDGAGAARAIALTVVGACFAVAAVGEVAGSGLVWVSPFGWARRVRAFADERWWVLLLFVAAAVLLAAVAFLLSAVRDVGAGLLAARPGPAGASGLLRGPLGLAWRVHRAAGLAWVLGLALIGALLGAAMASVGAQLDTPAFRELATTLGGGSPAAVFFRSALYVLAQVVAASMVTAALRMRGQETGGLADVLLAGPVDRVRWALGHVAIASAGGLLALAGLGVGAGLGYGDPSGVLATTLAYFPACLVFAAVAVALLGWVPRLAAPLAWAVLGLAICVDFLAEFHLAAPAVVALSPFVDTQLALVAGSGLAAVAVVWCVVAAALVAAGLVGLRRRDLA